ncbi:hypothetical protein GWI33_008103 [Rhynchophorus ferrugineus]|uniref:Kinesin motor domain-containing protein n=1 Tax=Rhynchophorus ferrugineus TaxID=354439 RepID=A0A834MCF4_RHYFE|nr:hypothetical protein GWI33_008103 [Rhynchophorus ferrugineus]
MTPETPSSSGSDTSKPPLKTGEERLMVAVRIRPLKSDEHHRALYAADRKTVILEDADKNDPLRHKRVYDKQYTFDVVFGEHSTQEDVYEVTTRNLVKDVLNGFNGTVFAYGPTGAGKTHTMVGDPYEPGIMIRALNDIFEAVRDKGDEYSVTMSYLELYNENIRDLLNPSSGYLELREDSRGRNIQVAGLSEISTTSTDEHSVGESPSLVPALKFPSSSSGHLILVFLDDVSALILDLDS